MTINLCCDAQKYVEIHDAACEISRAQILTVSVDVTIFVICGCFIFQDGSLYRQPRRQRRPYLTESAGSLPSSPYRLPDEEAYETTQEYASSQEPIRSRRRPRRNRLNGHISQRSGGPRDYSSQSFSQSEEEEDDEEEDEAHGESTPFLSMQNMNVDPPSTVPGFRSSSGADTRTPSS